MGCRSLNASRMPFREYGQVMNSLNGILLAFKDLQPIYAAEIASVQQYRDQLRDAQKLADNFNAPAPGSTPAASQAGVSSPSGTAADPVVVEVTKLPPARPFSPAHQRAMTAAEVEGPGAGMAAGATAEQLQAVIDRRNAEAA